MYSIYGLDETSNYAAEFLVEKLKKKYFVYPNNVDVDNSLTTLQ